MLCLHWLGPNPIPTAPPEPHDSDHAVAGSAAGGGVTGSENDVLPRPNEVRRRNKVHRAFLAAQPCLVCQRSPCDAHHLKFAQPRPLGRKVSDEFTVPLCRDHHRDCIALVMIMKSLGGPICRSRLCKWRTIFGKRPSAGPTQFRTGCWSRAREILAARNHCRPEHPAGEFEL
jgi:hypothetical protein